MLTFPNSDCTCVPQGLGKAWRGATSRSLVDGAEALWEAIISLFNFLPGCIKICAGSAELALAWEAPGIKSWVVSGCPRACVKEPAYLMMEGLASCIGLASFHLALFSGGEHLSESSLKKKKNLVYDNSIREERKLVKDFYKSVLIIYKIHEFEYKSI